MNSNCTVSEEILNNFRSVIWEYYKSNGRSFNWRNIENPYYILISEIMLQQTQTSRVKEKYEHFITRFPTVHSLAEAPLQELLFYWQGLGYNRRALFLQKTAQKIVHEHQGIIPQDPAILINFPGIGKATAASICAFAFNMPTLFIETNIRAVFIHFFFAHHDTVDDIHIMELVERTVDKANARHWYYALMDYGVMLKKEFPNPSRKSKHYTRQSRFEGSDRQIRGAILRILTLQAAASEQELFDQFIEEDRSKIVRILNDLCQEGFLVWRNNKFSIQ